MITQALIHAGGEGTRLRPVTYEIPKPLVPVQGKPILTWLIEWLAQYGVKRVLVTISPKWKAAFESWQLRLSTEHPEVQIDLWVEPEPMGTMGAAVHYLKDTFNQESIFVTNGDELKGFDLTALSNVHEEHAYTVTLGLVAVEEPQHYGVPELAGTKVLEYREKPSNPTTNFVHAGLYALNTAILSQINTEKRFLMFEKDLFPNLAATGMLGATPLAGPWFDCGTLERWEKAIKEWTI
jgi:mannose-1-phosphate guanylyltransferase